MKQKMDANRLSDSKIAEKKKLHCNATVINK